MNNTGLIDELEGRVHAALETYCNVHRGSGQFSIVTTHLYEKARDIILEYLGLDRGKYVVIFGSPLYTKSLSAELEPGSFIIVSSKDFSLPLGVSSIAVYKRKLPKGVPFYTGGGTTTIFSPDWIIWANSPDRFEAGTPAIINVIAFAIALQLIKQNGNEIFLIQPEEQLSVTEILYRDKLEKFTGPELFEELKLTFTGRGVSVPTAEGIRPYINLDNSASTPTFEPVWKSVSQTLRQPLNVQKEIIEEVRSICAGAFGAPINDYDIIFTSNTTEAINLVAENLGLESNPEQEPVVVTTLLEHSSNDLPWRFKTSELKRLSIDNEGFVKKDELEGLLSSYNQKNLFGKKRIKIVAISGASNVLGSINNLEEISNIVHSYGAHLLVDAAQLAGHRKTEMLKWGIDYLAFSAHKVYAPFGTGVLIVRKGLLNFKTEDLKQIKSSGEENTAGIAALGKALVILQRIGFDLIVEKEKALISRTLLGMSQINGLTVYGVSDSASAGFNRKAGVIAFTLKGFMSDKVAKELSIRRGIGIRNGCHCAHILVKHILGVKPSLERFQKIIARLFPRIKFPGVARVSFGLETTIEDVDTLIDVLGKIAGKANPISHKETEKQIKDYVSACAKRVYS